MHICKYANSFIEYKIVGITVVYITISIAHFGNKVRITKIIK